MNNIAQLVEVVHSFEDSIRLINELEAAGLQANQTTTNQKSK